MPEDISGLLKDCTVRIKIDRNQDQYDGTGFFVTPNLILTCAHVVLGCKEEDYIEEIYILATGNIHKAKLKSIYTDENVDLAILEIEGETLDHRCAYLAKPKLDLGCKFYTFGYPKNNPDGDSVQFNYEGPCRKNTNKTPYFWHKLTGGYVEEGLSGSPLLQISTGLVCGIISIHYSNNEQSYTRALSTESIFYIFPDLENYRFISHTKDKSWHNLIPGLNQENGKEDLSGNPDYCKAFIYDVLKNPENSKDVKLVRRLYEKYKIQFTAVLESLLDRYSIPSCLHNEKEELVISTIFLIGDCEESISILYKILNNINAEIKNRLRAKSIINSMRNIDLKSISKEWIRKINYPIRFPTDRDVIPIIQRIREFRSLLSDENISDLLKNQNSITIISSFLDGNGAPPILENSFYLFLSIENKDFYTLIRNSSLKERFIEHEKKWMDEV